jgi:hypothetical protein
MHGEIAALDAAGEYAEQFKNARRLLSTGKNSKFIYIRRF